MENHDEWREDPKQQQQLSLNLSDNRPVMNSNNNNTFDRESGESDISESHSAYAASLVMSAAKSVLDTSTSLVSDDASEKSEDGINLPKSPIASLQSLQTQTMPAYPDEQDRRRFLGCLAAVLASQYDYDFAGGETDEEMAAYFEVYVREEEGFYESRSTMDDSRHSINNIQPTRPNKSMPMSMSMSMNNSVSNTTASTTPTKKLSTTSFFTRKKTQQDSQPLSTYECFDDSSISSIPEDDDDTIDEFTPGLSGQRAYVSQASTSSMSTYFRRESLRMKLALQRHRRRRYQVLSGVLLNASVYLNLDKAQAKAFLPLLARVMKPPTKGASDETLTILQPFLESLSPGAGFRCLALLLLEHLLRSEEGYDARVRYVYKCLGVTVIKHQWDLLERDGVQCTEESATRKFEALEHSIARKILVLSGGRTKRRALTKEAKESGYSRESVVRGLKIGAAGVAAGTLLAFTGGLAAPGIAASVIALAGTSTATIVALTSTAAVTTIFGVSGASLAAYKMHRRQKGLTEFEFQKESGKGEEIEAELFTTICISGWLRDDCDFQRPWGVTPSSPPIRDYVERLERFYSIYKPENLQRCQRILSSWKGEEAKLWGVIKSKYGKDPDDLFPLDDGPRLRAALTLAQEEVIDDLFIELKYAPPRQEQQEEEINKQKLTTFERMKTGWSKRTYKQDDKEFNEHRVSTPSVASTHLERHHFAPTSPPLVSTTSQPSNQEEKKEEGRKQVPDHIQTVWDYQSTYGGELYTVRFESSMLIELCSSVEDLAMDAVYSSTQQALKLTVFATLITAAAIPVALLRAANMIDSSWTIAIERADEAGRELAKSLLFSQAGRRPVSLVGFSMGARTIYCCLKELAKYQDIWEEIRDREAQGIKVSFKANSPYQGLEKMREPASILEDVIVMGMPQHLSTRSWHASRQMIAGRFVNCYSRKDMILTLMFRYKRLKFKSVCGTCAVDVPGVENIDVSDLITAHAQYCYKIGEILKRVRHGQATRGPGDTIVVDAKLDEDIMPDLGVDKTW